MLFMNNRIKELREQLKMSQEDLAQAVGTTNQQIGRLEKSRRNLTQKWMERLAPALHVRPPELLPISTFHHRIRLVGAVQAGLFRTVEEEWEDGEIFDIPLPAAYQGLRTFALRVDGPSMNLLYKEGTILICCHLDDLHEQPIPGRKYIIEDRDEAEDIETTVKEFVVDAAGAPWAWPRSDHPDWQQPVRLDVGRPGHTIRMKARVIFALIRE